MKRMLMITILIAGLAAINSFAQMTHHEAMHGQTTQQQTDQTTQQDWYGPYPHMMGYGAGYGMGPGMMGYGAGYGMGPGMMGYGTGYGTGPGMMGHHYMMHGGTGMMGYGAGPCMMGTGAWGYDQEAYKKFLDESKDLRRKLHNKKFDYQEALRDPETTRETITGLQTEMQDIQKKINEKYPR